VLRAHLRDPAAGLAAHFSSIRRIAPPPFGREIDGGASGAGAAEACGPSPAEPPRATASPTRSRRPPC
jgi:hypothetical protein